MNYNIKSESNKNINHRIWETIWLNPPFARHNTFPKIVTVRCQSSLVLLAGIGTTDKKKIEQ